MADVTTYSFSALEALACLALGMPLLSALIAWIVPKRYAWAATLAAPICLLVSALSGALLFYYGWQQPPRTLSLPWLTLGDHTITVGLHIDSLAVLMTLVVTVISFLVHLYSTGYMAGDPAVKKYFAVLGFFTFSMLGIVLANNLLQLFICWELVGFSSYLLIGHYTMLPAAAQAAQKAFIVNRVGDAGFLAGLLILYTQTGSFNVTTLNAEALGTWQTAFGLCLFCGVAGKSAQFPLLTWLPDAMAGPTPVSALIHAATMVAAGVFLLARVTFAFSPAALEVVALAGGITALFGGMTALFQFDIKKILAYSTISQLGYMVLAMGVGAAHSAMLHLFTHAFFKAGLFLGAGAVIHALHVAQHDTAGHFDVQDIRNLGQLRKALPVTFITFLICGAALSALPLTSGFQSKDAILSATLAWAAHGPAWRWGLVAITWLVSFMTVCYTFRMIWFVFIKPSNGPASQLTIREVPLAMRLPMLFLSACAGWWIVSWNPFSFSGWQHHFEESSHGLTYVSAAWVFIALGFAWWHFRHRALPTAHTQPPATWLGQAFYLDQLYTRIIVAPLLKLTQITTYSDRHIIDRLIHFTVYAQVTLAHLIAWCDHTIIDGMVNGAARVAGSIGRFTRSFQTGKVQSYVFWTAFALAVAIICFLF